MGNLLTTQRGTRFPALFLLHYCFRLRNPSQNHSTATRAATSTTGVKKPISEYVLVCCGGRRNYCEQGAPRSEGVLRRALVAEPRSADAHNLLGIVLDNVASPWKPSASTASQ